MYIGLRMYACMYVHVTYKTAEDISTKLGK